MPEYREPPANRLRNALPEEIVRQMKEDRAAGYSASQIATRFSIVLGYHITKHKVYGELSRSTIR